MKYISLLTLAFLFSFSLFGQVQIGDDIDGEAEYDQSGSSVSLSSDGNIVAIGAYFNSNDAGHVRIYENQSGKWKQLGMDIDGQEPGDYSGVSVSLSSDGRIVAIGAHHNAGSSGAGNVRIYQYKSGNWGKIGNTIYGESTDDRCGVSVSLSSDGGRLAIGAHFNDGIGSNSGHVRIYENQSGSWEQLGGDIDGEALGDQSGFSVSLSSDGNIVAIGAMGNNGSKTSSNSSGADVGHVRIYRYNSNTWNKVGDDIDGINEGDKSGNSVSLSSDGSILAIGASLNDNNGVDAGHVRVYENQSGSWKQLGRDINGEAARDQSGFALSLSSDGNILAIGSISNSNASGHVRLYKNQSGNWNLIKDIDGEAKNDRSGWSVSLSSDGSIVAIGATNNDGNGNNAGHVRIYQICELKSITKQPKNLTTLLDKRASMWIESNYKWYQWQTDIGSGFQNITDTSQFEGINSDTLTIKLTVKSNNNQKFRCIVNDQYCSDTSVAALLSLYGVSVYNLRNNQIFHIYPNPTSNELNIKIESNLLGSQFRIINTLGQEVRQGELSKLNSTIDVSKLPKGSYNMLIGTENYSHPFLVE
jgi:hypothetical protein